MQKILILDDDRDFLEGIRNILEDAGYAYIATDDSRTVQQKVRTYRPSVVILDVFLNEFRGENIAKQLKNSPDTSAIPIILVSGSDRIRDFFEQSGAETFLQKPFSGRELITTISDLVNTSGPPAATL